MVERASAQLCLWEGRRGTRAGRIERDNDLPAPLMKEHPTPQLTHPVSPSPCKKITWKKDKNGMGRSPFRSSNSCLPLHCPPQTWGDQSGSQEIISFGLVSPVSHSHLHVSHTAYSQLPPTSLAQGSLPRPFPAQLQTRWQRQ